MIEIEEEPRIDRITARAKDVKSFVAKAKNQIDGKPKYTEPLSQIQDQLGVRIITFFKSDVERLDEIVKKYFLAIEYKDWVPDSEWEFGYFGRHYVLLLPSDVIDDSMDAEIWFLHSLSFRSKHFFSTRGLKQNTIWDTSPALSPSPRMTHVGSPLHLLKPGARTTFSMSFSANEQQARLIRP
jgi:hypothetical protein